jgi:hypothetical protein
MLRYKMGRTSRRRNKGKTQARRVQRGGESVFNQYHADILMYCLHHYARESLVRIFSSKYVLQSSADKRERDEMKAKWGWSSKFNAPSWEEKENHYNRNCTAGRRLEEATARLTELAVDAPALSAAPGVVEFPA